jgi:hypothetical protein
MLEPALRWGLSSWGMLIWEPYAPVAWAEALAGLALTVAAITVGPRGGIRERSGHKTIGRSRTQLSADWPHGAGACGRRRDRHRGQGRRDGQGG